MISRQKTILLVDDEKNILDLATMYLVRDGFLIETSMNGSDALEKIKNLRPDLVVLDLMLPGLDGFEICRKLRFEDNQVPIILLTARDEDVDKILGLELGADDYMTKQLMGLTIAREIARIHNGDLTVASALGQGTTFTVHLPLTKPSSTR